MTLAHERPPLRQDVPIFKGNREETVAFIYAVIAAKSAEKVSDGGQYVDKAHA